MEKRGKVDNKVRKEIPIGVKLTSILFLVVGILLLVITILYCIILIITILILIIGGEAGHIDPPSLRSFIIIIIGLPSSVLLIVSSIGLWKLKKWARILAIVSGILLFLWLINTYGFGAKFNLRFSFFNSNFIVILLTMLFGVVISLYLLFSKKVKKAFS